MAPARCCVNGCLNNKQNRPESTQFRLPNEIKRRSQWLQLIRREDLLGKAARSYTVCEEHFLPQEVLVSEKRKLLVACALPSRNLPSYSHYREAPPLSIAVISKVKSTLSPPIGFSYPASVPVTKAANSDLAPVAQLSTTTDLQPTGTIPHKSLKRKICGDFVEITNKVEESDSDKGKEKPERVVLIKLCDSLQEKDFDALVKAQTLSMIGPVDNSINFDNLLFYLNAYYASTETYRQLLSKLPNFPGILALKKRIVKEASPLTTEINAKAMSFLKAKVEHMTAAEKKCSVMIGEMKIKPHLYYNIKDDKVVGFHEVGGWQSPEPARSAQVLVARGLLAPWTQPVGYALLAPGQDEDELSDWLENTLKALIDIGLDVCTFVTHLDTEFLKVTRGQISERSPFFTIQDKKIYYIYDPLYLFELLRNKFSQNILKFEGVFANYIHVLKLIDDDTARRTCDFALNLDTTSQPMARHLKLTNPENAKTCLAGELFSKPVAVALSFMIDSKKVDLSANGTLIFIKEMSYLYDVLINSKARGPNTCTLEDEDAQVHYLIEIYNGFDKMLVLEQGNRIAKLVTTNIKFITAFKITLSSIMILFHEVGWKGKQFSKIKTLNRNAVEDLFDEIRSRNGYADPTCKQFKKVYRELFYADLMKSIKRVNRKQHLLKYLVKPPSNDDLVSLAGADASLSKASSPESAPPGPGPGPGPEVLQQDYARLELPARGALLPACVQLLRRCQLTHSCDKFEIYVKPIYCRQQPGLFKRYEQYKKNNRLTRFSIVPCDEFIEYVESLEEVFMNSFSRSGPGARLAADAAARAAALPPPRSPCPCLPRQYLDLLYMRMRIFQTLTQNNKLFKDSGYKIKYFSLTNL